MPTADCFKCVNLPGLQKTHPGVTNHSLNQCLWTEHVQPLNKINSPCWQSNIRAQRQNGHECYTTEPLFYTYRAILIEKRMKTQSPVNKETWKTALTSNQKKIIFRASNYQSLSIKLGRGRTQGKQHNKVKTVTLKHPYRLQQVCYKSVLYPVFPNPNLDFCLD